MFADRREAGRRLAPLLAHLREDDPIVVGLPRGGVPVAEEVARVLRAPLDVILVRKLGVPFQPELGMGAIGEGEVRVINEDVVAAAGVSWDQVAEVETRERAELQRRAARYRAGRAVADLAGRVVVIVDDGIATGSTAKAACAVARAAGARKVVLAVPVAPQDWTDRLAGAADELICVDTPAVFFGVGQFYRRFTQTTDDEVTDCLARAAHELGHAGSTRSADRETEVELQVGDGGSVGGHLVVPANAVGLVLFAHGSGSSRHSPRNRHVASVLQQAGMATLLFDLLTHVEEHDRAKVFDIGLLGERLRQATAWTREQSDLAGMPVGYFGASTGAAAALWAAADPDPDTEVAAVVSRGGRPDLAGSCLADVAAPTLLIVGSRDEQVLELNRQAQAQMRCRCELAVVPGATHLFEEPGALDVAAELAADWFRRHFESPRDGS